MNLSDIDLAILCGGQGNRIRDHLPPGLPKCMANINGTPFIEILLIYLSRQLPRGRFYLRAGYGSDKLVEYFDSHDIVSKLQFCQPIELIIESEPLGTGGAIVNALSAIQSDPFLVVNGDTICDIDFKALLDNHLQVGFPITVPINDQYRNVGIYVVTKAAMQIAVQNLGPKFDLDDAVKDFPKAGVLVNWYPTRGIFHDIGTIEGLENFRYLQKDRRVRAD